MGAQRRRTADTKADTDALERTPAGSFAESGLTWREWIAAGGLQADTSDSSMGAVTDDSSAAG